MKLQMLMTAAAAALMFASAPTTAAPPTQPHMSTEPHMSPPGQGQFQGQGYNHMNSGQARGQPNQSCETTGSPPGNSGSAPGGGSPFIGDSSTAGSHYAGSQPQNSRNTASVSQYDVACANQPH
jgi:hypothetical protein